MGREAASYLVTVAMSVYTTLHYGKRSWLIPGHSSHVRLHYPVLWEEKLAYTWSQYPCPSSLEQLYGQSWRLQSVPAYPGRHTHLLPAQCRRSLGQSLGHVFTWYVALKPFTRPTANAMSSKRKSKCWCLESQCWCLESHIPYNDCQTSTFPLVMFVHMVRGVKALHPTNCKCNVK
jgi:hypothetical protein